MAWKNVRECPIHVEVFLPLIDAMRSSTAGSALFQEIIIMREVFTWMGMGL